VVVVITELDGSSRSTNGVREGKDLVGALSFESTLGHFDEGCVHIDVV